MSALIKAIIFDLDGVIIDSNPAIIEFWEGWAKQEGFVLNDAMIREWVFGRKVSATIDGLFSNLTNERKKEIEQAGYLFDQAMQPSGILGIQKFIESLTEVHFILGVATSSHHARMLQMLERVGVANHFIHFVTAHDVSKGKPDPEPYLKMAEKLCIDAAHCLVFEDANSGVQSAKSAGMQIIGIGNDITRDELLLHGAMEVIADFTEIKLLTNQLLTLNGNTYLLETY
ncbi:MAG: HAD family phosphatase [Bacteroidetes bacterium]|nr:HAD family phosphatase [Bacteroidota bacterium]